MRIKKRWKRTDNNNESSLFVQLKKKYHQLEERLDHEMQAKDELEQKCKYGLLQSRHALTAVRSLRSPLKVTRGRPFKHGVVITVNNTGIHAACRRLENEAGNLFDCFT